MDHTTQMQHLLGLSGMCATADDAARMLSEALPAITALAAADAAAVVRRDGEALPYLSHHEGTRLDVADVDVEDLVVVAGGETGSATGSAETLRPMAAPAPWLETGIEHIVLHRLPGHHGVLVLGWTTAEPVLPAGLGVAVASLDGGLARVGTGEDLRDLAARVDNAQHLAHMGDYDWHISSDTNRWSDELFRIYGYEPGAFNPSYERFVSLIHPEDRERITGVHQDAYATGEPYEMIERIVRPDGSVRYLSSNGQVVMDQHGTPARMRGTCIDITDRVLAEREREQIGVRYRSLVEAAPEAILLVDGSDQVIDANPRAHDLLGGDPTGRSVLDLLPARSDGQGVQGRRLDGSALVVDISRTVISPDDDDPLMAVFLRDASLRLAGESLAARLSQARLRRRQALEINDNVVQGLVAARYSLDAEQYPVVASYVERTLDSARAMMDDLLEPLDGEDLMPGDLVRVNAADISKREARSTLVDEAEVPARTAGPAATAVRAGKKRVLVVDDADELRVLLRGRLERTPGFTVVGEAADGIAAVAAARELQPDLVLLDLAMPRMDGLEALPLIRKAVPGVRVIVFSGFDQNTLAQKAIAAGADHYMVKGGPMSKLLELVESVLQPSA
jgi:PAS domain S-box-containing protein